MRRTGVRLERREMSVSSLLASFDGRGVARSGKGLRSVESAKVGEDRSWSRVGEAGGVRGGNSRRGGGGGRDVVGRGGRDEGVVHSWGEGGRRDEGGATGRGVVTVVGLLEGGSRRGKGGERGRPRRRDGEGRRVCRHPCSRLLLFPSVLLEVGRSPTRLSGSLPRLTELPQHLHLFPLFLVLLRLLVLGSHHVVVRSCSEPQPVRLGVTKLGRWMRERPSDCAEREVSVLERVDRVERGRGRVSSGR